MIKQMADQKKEEEDSLTTKRTEDSVNRIIRAKSEKPNYRGGI